MPQAARVDASHTTFVEREVTHFKSKPLEIQRADIRFRDLIPPANDPAPRGAKSIVWRVYDKRGFARLLAGYETEIPNSDVHVEEITSRVHSVGAGYKYDVDEIEAAQFAGRPLASDKRGAAMESAELELQRVCYRGEPKLKLPGFFTNPNIPVISAASDGGDITWAAKKAAGKVDAVLADLNNLVNYAPLNTNGREVVDTLLLSQTPFYLLQGWRIGVDSNMTVLKAWLETNMYVKNIEVVPDLDTASQAGGHLAVAYARNSRVLGREIPKEPEEMPAQPDGFVVQVPIHGTTGGTCVHYPLACAFMTGHA